jgi:hypothetical protein
MSIRSNTTNRSQGSRLAGVAIAALATLVPVAQAAAEPPSKHVTGAEERRAESIPMETIVREAEPLPSPRVDELPSAGAASERRRGPRVSVPGTAPRSASSASARRKAARRKRKLKVRQNGPWGGAFNANPNLQIGKLFFDVQPGPGERWSVCSGTAVNSENRSLVVTAGHCIYDPDPDGDNVVQGNGYWFENVKFCPGYENGCNLGVWTARSLGTTNKWFYGNGGRYDWSDDMGVVLVNPNESGYLVDRVGGQGITFNDYVGLDRSAFGYPEADSRWPRYRYNGQDLIYCGGRDQYASGRMIIGCTMTGGASGGPWLSSFDSSGLGYLNGVNSHKPGSRSVSATVVGSPYFGDAEAGLFEQMRAG